MDTLSRTLQSMDVDPANLDLVRDQDNDCWVLVNRSPDYVDPDHNPQATIAVFPDEATARPLADWLLTAVRDIKTRDEAA